MVFEIQPQPGNRRQLTQAVLQIIQLLNMVNAELARILHCRCEDIGPLANARSTLQPDTQAWQHAEQLVHFYQLLYRYKQGDGVAMQHWFRSRHNTLGNTPHLLIVDADDLEQVIALLQAELESQPA
jgi:hypothetical protein